MLSRRPAKRERKPMEWQILVKSKSLCVALGIMVIVPYLFEIAATFPIWSPPPPLPPTPPIPKIKTFEQVQQELEGENVTVLNPQASDEARVAQVLKDLQQVSAYWTNQTLTAREIAQRYGVATTPNPVCVKSQTTNVGFVPCSQCDLEGDHGKIPKLIHQTWKNSQLEMPICEAALSWTQVNPEYDYILMDDAAIPRMVELDFGPNILASYNCIGVGAAKSDVARLLFIFLYGGIYFDLDSKAKEEFPFRSWGFGNHTVVTGMGEDRNPHQWGLLYTPQHPIIKKALQLTLSNIARQSASHVYEVSYNAFQQAFQEFRQSGEHDIMPGWKDFMGNRVIFQNEPTKAAMLQKEYHWAKFNTRDEIWKC